MPKFPLIPTIIVIGAVAVMIWLGFWQLGRMDEKAALLEQYSSATGITDPVDWPMTEAEVTQRLYRQSAIACLRVTKRRTTAATSADGVKGLAQIASCVTGQGQEVEVALGFTRQPVEGDWQGGPVTGIVAPGPRLVALPALAGLDQLARPDPADLPNNHLAYAGQWFFFALTALIIYILALKRQQAPTKRED